VAQHGEVYRMSQAMRRFPPRGKQRPKKEVINAVEEE
jgi:hypothetical protein